jgi:hypothetical protein
MPWRLSDLTKQAVVKVWVVNRAPVLGHLIDEGALV